jgi:hypothetical protein
MAPLKHRAPPILRPVRNRRAQPTGAHVTRRIKKGQPEPELITCLKRYARLRNLHRLWMAKHLRCDLTRDSAATLRCSPSNDASGIPNLPRSPNWRIGPLPLFAALA